MLTRQITMNLPDDVAEYIITHENSSVLVTTAVRAQIDHGATTRAMLKAAGFTITDEGCAKWRDKLRPLTAEQIAENASWIAAIRAGHRPADEAPE
ncbi:hypothetical protein [Actinoplanes sp. NPDC051494]|uniref:hypothetical protein n=1 Tax=Actinoplanes sp. NPDC051494 TaxID=3363907 RepID=UPI0037AEAD98